MTKEKLTGWLDRQVELFNLVKAERWLYDEPDESGCSNTFTYEYSMSQGNALALDNIQQVAEVLGVKLTARERHDDDYPTELSFEYKGVSFYSLSEKGADEFE